MANNNVVTFEQLKKTAEYIKVELNKKADNEHGTHVTFPNLDEFTSLNFGDSGYVGMSPKCARSDHTHTLPAFPLSLKNPEKLTIQLDGVNAVEYDGSVNQTLDISCASIGASEDGHQHDFLYIKGTNTISSVSNDTTSAWGAHESSIHWYDTSGQLIDQPYQWGYVLNIGRKTEVHQIWMGQAGLDMYHRGGNGSGWSGTWKKIIDDTNYTDLQATDEEVSAMLLEAYGNVSIGDGNITTNATDEEISNMIRDILDQD